MYEAEQLTLEPSDLKIPTRNAARPPRTIADREEPISFEEPVLVGGSERLRLHRQFVSTLLPARRDVIVALPPDYFTASRRYPVLYLQDGQNLFDPETSFIKGNFWDVQRTADGLIGEKAIEPLIVVGIYNTGIERMEEYTPMPDRNLGGGKGELYGRLLVEELKPWVDRSYRTLDGATNTGVGGSSLGGLESLYIGLTWPHVFGRLAILSPSVWWAQGAMLQYVRRTRPEPRPRIWLDMGLSEGPTMIEKCDALHRLLERRGWHDGKDMQYLRVPGGRHNEDAWAKRVDPFLRFLFPAK
ncbi:MAG: alpha/beta hydrolase-fold protein [Acidobacteriaceae bacterium]